MYSKWEYILDRIIESITVKVLIFLLLVAVLLVCLVLLIDVISTLRALQIEGV